MTPGWSTRIAIVELKNIDIAQLRLRKSELAVLRQIRDGQTYFRGRWKLVWILVRRHLVTDPNKTQLQLTEKGARAVERDAGRTTTKGVPEN